MIRSFSKALLIAGLLSQGAMAQEGQLRSWFEGFDSESWYLGGGIANNTVDFGFVDGTATGFQLYAGKSLKSPESSSFKFGVEGGYLMSGTFEWESDFATGSASGGNANGFWGAVVSSVDLNPKTQALAKVGYDIGDDDGVFVGAGIGYQMTSDIALRGEYVIRPNINSLQLNAVYQF